MLNEEPEIFYDIGRLKPKVLEMREVSDILKTFTEILSLAELFGKEAWVVVFKVNSNTCLNYIIENQREQTHPGNR